MSYSIVCTGLKKRVPGGTTFDQFYCNRHGSRVHKGEALRVLQYGDKSSETIHFYMKCGQMKCLSGLEMPGISIYKPSIAFFRVYTCNEKVIE